jgi:ferritin
MMMIQYLLDKDLPARIPGVDDVRNDVKPVRDATDH